MGLSKEELLRMVQDIASPTAASFGLEIWGVELSGAGRPVIRIFVDVPPAMIAASATISPTKTDVADDLEFDDAGLKDVGASIDHCAEISRMVGLAMEVENFFPEAWVLEVSSPGLERLFFRPHQLVPYLGRELEVTLWDPHPETPSRRKFRGDLISVEGDEFTLRVEAEGAAQLDITIVWNSVRKARLIHIFPDTSKPGQNKAANPAKAGSNKGGGKKA